MNGEGDAGIKCYAFVKREVTGFVNVESFSERSGVKILYSIHKREKP